MVIAASMRAGSTLAVPKVSIITDTGFATPMALMRIKPQQLGKNVRMSFSKIDEILQMPDLLEVQKNSYQWLLDKGITEVLQDVSPIVDYSGNFVIEFVDYSIDSTPKYPVEECKARDVN